MYARALTKVWADDFFPRVEESLETVCVVNDYYV